MGRQTIVGIGGFPDAAVVDYVLGSAGGFDQILREAREAGGVLFGWAQE